MHHQHAASRWAHRLAGGIGIVILDLAFTSYPAHHPQRVSGWPDRAPVALARDRERGAAGCVAVAAKRAWPTPSPNGRSRRAARGTRGLLTCWPSTDRLTAVVYVETVGRAI